MGVFVKNITKAEVAASRLPLRSTKRPCRRLASLLIALRPNGSTQFVIALLVFGLSPSFLVFKAAHQCHAICICCGGVWCLEFCIRRDS